MRLDEVFAGVETLERVSSGAEVRGVQYDSRRVRPGDIFVAMRGGSVDGNRFVAGAVAAGASAVGTDSRAVWERRDELGAPVALVASGRRALAGVAANLLGHPERALKVCAVTGTNGKTTTAFLLEQMLRSVGRRCVLIGTIETHVGDEVRVSEHTTPEASDLLRVFADGVEAGCTEAVMEMSSHALEQERVWGVPVDVGIFTNLTQDHLDYHGTMEAYGAAKARMFAGVGTSPPRVAILNADDGWSEQMIANLFETTSVQTYGIDAGSYRARNLSLTAGRTSFTWETPQGEFFVKSPLTGRVNVYNLMAACCAALSRGMAIEEVIEAAQHLEEVPGRFQVVNGSVVAGFSVVVDYAHTDDALRNLIALARDLVGKKRVITVFGCGGDRDRTKRPKMGRAAGEGSDLSILTSDNPRTEDADGIINEVLTGLVPTGGKFLVVPDRAEAIGRAIQAAEPGDIVLIAGKGHEKVQIVGAQNVPFDDVEVAVEALRPVLAQVRSSVAEQKEGLQ